MDLPGGAPYFISEELGNQLVSRMVMLGLDADAAKLRAWVKERNRGITLTGSFGPDERLWEMTMQRVLGESAPTKDKAGENLEQLMRAFRAICKEIAGLDPAALRRDRESRRTDSIEGSLTTPSHRSISVYESTLEGMLGKLFTSMQLNYQVLLDEAIAELEGGKGTKGLEEAKKMLEERIKPLVFFRAGDFSPEDVLIDATRSTFGRGGGRYLDVFTPKAKARSIGFTFYDTLQKEGDEKQLALGRIWRHRHNQIELLERLYGVGKANAENATVLKQLGGLRLHNNDDWRRFLIAKFEAAEQRLGDKGKALSEVINLLKAYLQAFTIHTPYNIEEFGDNYLTRSFPRALTGQLIHDCGVYALRIAYALSLIKDRLKLRFRFIRLPAHVGLVITGKGLPTFIAHNNDVTEFGVQELDDMQKFWTKHDEQGKELAKPRARDDDRFLGEVAAGLFLPFTDMPFRFEEQPKFKNDDKGEYFRFYQRKLQPDILGKGKGATAQFHLRYLEALDDAKRTYNTKVRPFWNHDARAVWRKHGAGLRRALGSAQKGGAAERKAYEAAADAYLKDLDKVYKPIEDAMTSWGQKVGETSSTLAKERELTAKGATRAHTRRVQVGFSWTARIEEHREAVRELKDLTAPGKLEAVVPPWALPDSDLAPVGLDELVERGLEVAAEGLGVGQDLGVGEDPEADLARRP